MYISLRPAHESSILHLPSFLFFLFPDSTITTVKPSQFFVMPAYNSGSARQLRSRNRRLASDETHRLPTASIGMASKTRDIIMSERIITDGPSLATDVDAAIMDEMAAGSTREDTAPAPASIMDDTTPTGDFAPSNEDTSTSTIGERLLSRLGSGIGLCVMGYLGCHRANCSCRRRRLSIVVICLAGMVVTSTLNPSSLGFSDWAYASSGPISIRSYSVKRGSFLHQRKSLAIRFQ